MESYRDRRLHLCVALSVGLTLLVLAISAPGVVWAYPDSTSPSGFLLELSQEYRRVGRYDDAVAEVRKVLLIDPRNEHARRNLMELQILQIEREQAIDSALNRIEQDQVAGTPRAIPATPSLRVQTSVLLRAPNHRVNGTEWLYVFGRHGSRNDGAEPGFPQVVFVEVPVTFQGGVSITILDADTRGRHDEMAGFWNTSTTFRVASGTKVLASRTINPDAADGTTITFGPFLAGEGEPQGTQRVFRVEAEGLEGDDNNLFAVAVIPLDAQFFAYRLAIRLAEQRGNQMRFFPAVPAGTTQIYEENFDLDADGGRIELVPPRGLGQAISLRPSGTGAKSSTIVSVPPNAAGARWTYRITKGTQRKGNMSFRLMDQSGRPLQTYFTWAEPAATAPLRAERVVEPTVHVGPSDTGPMPRACQTFVFDASASSDADRDALTYHWDFGDGTTGEGVRAQHTYAKAGTYRVVLTVSDSSGMICGRSSAEQTIRVNPRPRAVLQAPTAACASEPVRFSAAQSTHSSDQSLRYLWEFGDGATADGIEVTHTYARGGTYRVSLRVDDQQGTTCSVDTATSTLQVNTSPTARMTIRATR